MSSADHPALDAVPTWSGLPSEALCVTLTGCLRPQWVNCVLLWARPGMEAAHSAYEDKVPRLVAEHGGRVLERGTVLSGFRHGIAGANVPGSGGAAAAAGRPR